MTDNARLATMAEVREQKLTVPQVAKILTVSNMTVYRMIHEGGLRAYRVGHKLVIPLSAVQAYLGGALVNVLEDDA